MEALGKGGGQWASGRHATEYRKFMNILEPTIFVGVMAPTWYAWLLWVVPKVVTVEATTEVVCQPCEKTCGDFPWCSYLGKKPPPNSPLKAAGD